MTVRVEEDGPVTTIINDRPEARNAVDPETGDALVEAFLEFDNDPDASVAVFWGAGGAFCAGWDLKYVSSLKPGEDPLKDLYFPTDGGTTPRGPLGPSRLDLSKPVIGAINGAAVGVGITMTLPMDIRLVAANSKIGFVFTQRGLTPEACSSWFLPRVVGIQKAMEWVISGDIFMAEEGVAAGLFHSAHDKGEVVDVARCIARKLIAKSSPVAAALAKQMLWRNPNFAHPMQAHAVESKMIYWSNEFWDGRDGFTSFLEKREPRFETAMADIPQQFDFWHEPEISEQ